MPTIKTPKMDIARQATPKAVFHMRFEETGADIASVSESLNGCKITANAADTWTDSGAGNAIAMNTVTNSSETVTECALPTILDTESALLIACCQPKNVTLAHQISYGKIVAADGITLAAGNPATVRGFSTSGNTNSLNLDQDATVDTDFMIAALFDRDAGVLRGYSQTGTGDVVATASTTPIDNWSGVELDQDLTFAGAVGAASLWMYSLTLYKWTGGLPSDLTTALQYFADNMKNDVKDLYSGWD